MTKVELFESIRRDYFVKKHSIRDIARRYKIHRRVVRQAIQNAVPQKCKRPNRKPTVLTDTHRRVIGELLQSDRKAPKKQRHTAHRIFVRLKSEHLYNGSESTVRRYVGQKRRELGIVRATYIPLTHDPGEEGEVDWYVAEVKFPWGQEKVHIFQMRACFSGREFHMAFPCETQQAFLEGHVHGFRYFSGVFHRMRYDNLKSAVTKILKGRRRKESDRFVALRSHYLFKSEFCRPGKAGAPEKGGVEGGVGRFRRNHLVPVPKCESFAAFNEFLLEACARDDNRRISGRSQSIASDWPQETAKFLSLPGKEFATDEVSTGRVDKMGRVRVRNNHYSVPVGRASRQVEVRVSSMKVEFYYDGKKIANHERLHAQNGESLELDHYLELLWYKPLALSQSKPLRQARSRGQFSEKYDKLWLHMKERYGETDGTRQLLDVLMMHRDVCSEKVDTAVGLALEYGCYDAGAIAVLLRQLEASKPETAPLADLGVLSRYERPVMELSDYDQLLSLALTVPASKEVH